MDIQVEDYIEHFGEDPEVKVILAYIEGLRDGRRFIEKAKKVTPRKPVIALKPGKSEVTARAIRSHSGLLCGPDEVYEAAFKKAGIIRAETPEELLDIATGFLTEPLPQGRNVAIITPGGSYGVICSDHCVSNKLNVVKLPEETIAEFDKIFPPRWSHGNPVDPAGDRNLVAFLEATEMILKLDVVDAVVFMGFGALSSLASTFLRSFLPRSETREEKGQPLELLDLNSMIPSLGGFLFQGDQGQKEIQRIVNLAIESQEIDAASFSSAGGLDLSRVLGFIDIVLANLVRHWMETYKKPVVPITFGDEGVYVKLKRGLYYAYSSPQRAARVLSKLAEYKEYLERC